MNGLIERPMWYTTADFISLVSPQLGYSLQIMPDAPFRLYGVAIFPLDGGGGTNIGQLKMRFTRPDQSWAQRHLVPTLSLAPGIPPTASNPFGYPSPNYFLFSPIYPNLIYPPNAVITIDIQRIDGTTVPLNCVVVFIGTNLYEEGRVYAPTYPAKFSAIPYFGYNVLCDAQLLSQGIVRDQPLNIQGDADFVWQGGVHTDVPVGQSLSVGIPNGVANVFFINRRLGTPSGLVTVSILNPQPTPNVPFSLSVAGSAITMVLQTDAIGNLVTRADDVVPIFNSNFAVQALGVIMSIANEGGSPPGFMPDTGGIAFPLKDGGDGSIISSGQTIDGNLINLGVRMKDWSGKYYSNVQTNQNSPLAGFVPAAVMFGFSNGQLPGLLYPEIYIPKNGTMQFDFAMLDGTLNPSFQTPILTLKGQKVYGG